MASMKSKLGGVLTITSFFAACFAFAIAIFNTLDRHKYVVGSLTHSYFDGSEKITKSVKIFDGRQRSDWSLKEDGILFLSKIRTEGLDKDFLELVRFLKMKRRKLSRQKLLRKYGEDENLDYYFYKRPLTRMIEQEFPQLYSSIIAKVRSICLQYSPPEFNYVHIEPSMEWRFDQELVPKKYHHTAESDANSYADWVHFHPPFESADQLSIALWMPILPVRDQPLALYRKRMVAQKSFFFNDMNGMDELLLKLMDDNSTWYYFSDMQPGEAILFVDEEIAHSSFSLKSKGNSGRSSVDFHMTVKKTESIQETVSETYDRFFS